MTDPTNPFQDRSEIQRSVATLKRLFDAADQAVVVRAYNEWLAGFGKARPLPEPRNPDEPPANERLAKVAKDLMRHCMDQLSAFDEQERQRLLANVEQPGNYLPGTFGCHEALHVASVLASHVEDDLLTHPAILQNSDWYARASRALSELFDLYQEIGSAHIAVHEKGERQLVVSPAEHATILAALRYWQRQGMDEPANRSMELHDIATNGDEVISLDATGIDELCERIN